MEQRVEELKMKFKYTIEVIREYFEKNVSQQATANWLLLVPSELKRLRAYLQIKNNAEDRFSELVAVSDYRHVELLQLLVGDLGDEDCKRAMALYQDDLNHFDCETTLGEFAKVQHVVVVSSSEQEEIVLTMGAKWEHRTVRDYEEMRKKLQRKARMSAHDLQMIEAENASVQVTLVLVSELAEVSNFKFVEPDFFKANGVLHMSAKDDIIYDVESPKV